MVTARHEQNVRERMSALEASRERGLWTAFTPVVVQGGAAETLDTASFAYYHYSQGVMRIEVYIKLDSAGVANTRIDITGWPVAYNVAGRAQRLVLGSFRVHDFSADDAFIGAAVCYGDAIAGESDNLGGQVCFGQTGSAFALALAVDDEISVSASWRV